MLSTIITFSLIGILLLCFLLAAAADLFMLFRRTARPPRGMGTGFSRIWAVAHTTLLEAWSARVWLLPILWLVASIVLVIAVRPYDESERIPLYIRMLLVAQEILLLVLMAILACVSLPRERDRKIIITNASKPLSRLEIMLGKMLGFSATAALLLVVMAALSWAILLYADQHMRSLARAEYTLAEADYKNKMGKLEDTAPPPEDKKRLADEGSLFAYNYLTVPKENLSIVGAVERNGSEVTRYLKGGSEEKALYRFTSPLLTADDPDILPSGQRPFFFFHFPVRPTGDMPDQILLDVSAAPLKQFASSGSPHVEEKVLTLNQKNNYSAAWEPERPSEIFSTPNDTLKGEIVVTVTCPTTDIFLQILEGQDPEHITNPYAFNVIPYNVLSFRNGLPPLPLPHPIMEGFERYDKQQVAGPTQAELYQFGPDNAPVEIAIFRFPAADLRWIPVENGKFTLNMVLDVDKEKNAEQDTYAHVVAYNDNAPANGSSATVRVIEKRDTQVTLPQSVLGDPDPAKRGDLVILLSCRTPGHWLAMDYQALRIENPPSPFLLNLLKSEAILFCEATLLIIIAVAFSVRLGWPVAMLATLVCFILGYLREFITGIIGLGGLGALGYNDTLTRQSHKFLDTLFLVFWKSLAFLIYILPDFTRFDFLSNITQLRNTPWDTLALDCGWTFLYSLPFIALGYLLFRKQELG